MASVRPELTLELVPEIGGYVTDSDWAGEMNRSVTNHFRQGHGCEGLIFAGQMPNQLS